jgi:hypothetical protein
MSHPDFFHVLLEHGYIDDHLACGCSATSFRHIRRVSVRSTATHIRTFLLMVYDSDTRQQNMLLDQRVSGFFQSFNTSTCMQPPIHLYTHNASAGCDSDKQLAETIMAVSPAASEKSLSVNPICIDLSPFRRHVIHQFLQGGR